MYKTDTLNKQKYWCIFPFYLAVMILFFMIAGCDSSTDSEYNGEDPPSQSPPATDEVNMDATSFEPANRTVEVGATVTWTNTNNMDHTVTSGVDGEPDGEFDSGTLSPGETFSHTFEEEGTYEYFCTLHFLSGMTGTITVGEDNNGNEDDNDNGSNGGDEDHDDYNDDIY